MDLAEILDIEDNPFNLFLILILLLGATGHFDPKSVGAQADGEVKTSPVVVTPVWQKRPPEAPPRGLIFSALARSNATAGNACASGVCGRRQSLAQALAASSRSKPQDTLAKLRKNIREFMGKPLPQRTRPRHPLLQVRHKMLQH